MPRYVAGAVHKPGVAVQLAPVPVMNVVLPVIFIVIPAEELSVSCIKIVIKFWEGRTDGVGVGKPQGVQLHGVVALPGLFMINPVVLFVRLPPSTRIIVVPCPGYGWTKAEVKQF